MAGKRRVRVGVTYGHDNADNQKYTYLVEPEKAQVGQYLEVPVRKGKSIYNTTATVVETEPKSAVKRPRRAK